MRIARAAALGAAALAVTATTLTATHVAGAADFDVTANGVSNGQTVAGLPPTSNVELAISGLPAGVGLYALHCLVPPPGASPVPTRCDAGARSLVYVMAANTDRDLIEVIRVNGEFVGSNPNPQTGDTGTTDVNCREDSCAIYTLGAGRDSANPAYGRYFPTTFAKIGPRIKDRATVTLNGKAVKPGRERVVSYSKSTPFSVTLTSGLKPSLTSKRCEVRGGEIRALTDRGSCTVRITSTGDDEYRPLKATVTFKIKK